MNTTKNFVPLHDDSLYVKLPPYPVMYPRVPHISNVILYLFFVLQSKGMDIRKYSPCMFCNDLFKGQSKGVIHTEGEIETGIVNKLFFIKSTVALILTDDKYQRQTSRLRPRMRKGSVWSVTYETLFYKFICDKQVYFAKLYNRMHHRTNFYLIIHHINYFLTQ